MPLPFIPLVLGGVAVGTALFGVKKGYDAYQDKKITDELKEEAQKYYRQTQKSVDSSKNLANKAFGELGELQKSIIETELRDYARIIDRLNIQQDKSLGDVFGEMDFSYIKETRDSIITLQSTLGSIVGGAAAGTMAGFGAFGSAGLLASASTGTAISALSGVAATNATLAWFGGGSLAAGGLGMAGGTMVLGGLVAGPVIAVASYVFAKSIESEKYNAKSYLEAIKGLCEAMQNEALIWKELANKAKEKISVLTHLKEALENAIQRVWDIVKTSGIAMKLWSRQDQLELKTMMQLTESVINLINAPLMNDSDELTCRLKNHQQEIKKLVEAINQKFK